MEGQLTTKISKITSHKNLYVYGIFVRVIFVTKLQLELLLIINVLLVHYNLIKMVQPSKVESYLKVNA